MTDQVTSLNNKRPSLETSPLWKRSSLTGHGHLVIVGVPNCNSNFLGLPTEIKLLICRRLFSRDITHWLSCITLLKCQESLEAMETLAGNARFLKDVTLRSPKIFSYDPRKIAEIAAEKKDAFSLSKLIVNLLENSKIICIKMVDFHLWSAFLVDASRR